VSFTASERAAAECTPQPPDNKTVICTGATGTGNSPVGYGTDTDTGNTITVQPGASVTGATGLLFKDGTVINRGTISGRIIGIGSAVTNSADVRNFGTISGSVGIESVGTANVNAGGDISGTIIGVGGINASGGGSVSASLLSQNITVGGSQAASGLATSVATSSTSQSAVQEANAQKTESTQEVAATDDDDTKKRAGKRPLLAKSTGRVTVILPAR